MDQLRVPATPSSSLLPIPESDGEGDETPEQVEDESTSQLHLFSGLSPQVCPQHLFFPNA